MESKLINAIAGGGKNLFEISSSYKFSKLKSPVKHADSKELRPQNVKGFHKTSL